MLCRPVEFRWYWSYFRCDWKTWVVRDETSERRRRYHYLQSCRLHYLFYMCVCVCVWLASCNIGPSFLKGNNIYGNDVREALLRIQKGGSEDNAAYILMQRIFPTNFPALLVREGICHQDHAISELGIYGAYLRYINAHCTISYLISVAIGMRKKIIELLSSQILFCLIY